MNHVYQRIFTFVQIASHTGESLYNVVLDLLQQYGINIENCRAQTYDNASNMSGKYSGLQARIKEINNLAYYVPCVGHSLNLVGECAVDECISATNFFGITQRVYAFLGPPHIDGTFLRVKVRELLVYRKRDGHVAEMQRS